jgi:hypothetical protein
MEETGEASEEEIRRLTLPVGRVEGNSAGLFMRRERKVSLDKKRKTRRC